MVTVKKKLSVGHYTRRDLPCCLYNVFLTHPSIPPSSPLSFCTTITSLPPSLLALLPRLLSGFLIWTQTLSLFDQLNPSNLKPWETEEKTFSWLLVLQQNIYLFISFFRKYSKDWCSFCAQFILRGFFKTHGWVSLEENWKIYAPVCHLHYNFGLDWSFCLLFWF